MRKPRLHYHGAMYHVITRGNSRQQIFSEQDDYKIFLEYLRTLKERKPFELYAFCLMPNHVHLLIEVKKEPLSVIMQRLLTGYTRYFNMKNKKRGHLFQGRYKAILCEKDSYLLELVRYIHLNPVRAKIVKKPSQWEWSGHGSLLGTVKNELIDEEDMLKLFCSEKNKARSLYEEFIRDGVALGHRGDYYPREKVPYLGNDRYIEKHISMHLDLIENKTPGTVKCSVTMKEILSRVCAGNGISQEAVQGGSRRREISSVRKEFIRSAFKSGHRAADIARFLNRTHSFISRLLETGR